jgi:predicted DNA-binding transcriptional regulator AlpA
MEALVAGSTNVRLLNSADLYKLGIRYVRQSLHRLEKAGKFPKHIKLTENGRCAWVESEVHDWLRERIERSRAGGRTA